MSDYSTNMDMIRGSARKIGIPLSGTFELTQMCNFSCGFCYVCERSKKNTLPKDLSTQEILGIVKQAVDAGMLECTFTGGEPFLREDFEEIYCKSYDMGLRISILTNASLLNEKHLRYLRKRKPDLISVSLYGATEASYKKICGEHADFGKVIENISNINNAILPLEIKILGLRPLLPEFESMANIISRYNCISRFDFLITSGRYNNRSIQDWRIPGEHLMEARKNLVKWLGITASSGEEKQKTVVAQAAKGMMCGAGKFVFFISNDGKMYGCPSLTCFETYPIKVGFIDAWTTLKKITSQAKTCDECRQCQFADHCSRCPANCLSESGTIEKCSSYIKEHAQLMSLQT